MTELEIKALEILKAEDQRFYIDMIDPIESGIAHLRYVSENGILMQIGKENGTWCWTAKDENTVHEIGKILKAEYKPGTQEAYSHCNVGLDYISGILGRKWSNVPCYVAALFSDKLFEIESDADFRKLDHSFDEFVYSTYRMIKDNPNGLIYARERIEAGMFGAFKDGRCIGFIGTHPEGTMGMLEILPEYRRKGYGAALEEYLANEYIKCGRIPYCHILEDNAASLKLQASMGFWISEDKRVYWLQ